MCVYRIVFFTDEFLRRFLWGAASGTEDLMQVSLKKGYKYLPKTNLLVLMICYWFILLIFPQKIIVKLPLSEVNWVKWRSDICRLGDFLAEILLFVFDDCAVLWSDYRQDSVLQFYWKYTYKHIHIDSRLVNVSTLRNDLQLPNFICTSIHPWPQ